MIGGIHSQIMKLNQGLPLNGQEGSGKILFLTAGYVKIAII